MKKHLTATLAFLFSLKCKMTNLDKREGNPENQGSEICLSGDDTHGSYVYDSDDDENITNPFGDILSMRAYNQQQAQEKISNAKEKNEQEIVDGEQMQKLEKLIFDELASESDTKNNGPKKKPGKLKQG